MLISSLRKSTNQVSLLFRHMPCFVYKELGHHLKILAFQVELPKSLYIQDHLHVQLMWDYLFDIQLNSPLEQRVSMQAHLFFTSGRLYAPSRSKIFIARGGHAVHEAGAPLLNPQEPNQLHRALSMRLLRGRTLRTHD